MLYVPLPSSEGDLAIFGAAVECQDVEMAQNDWSPKWSKIHLPRLVVWRSCRRTCKSPPLNFVDFGSLPDIATIATTCAVGATWWLGFHWRPKLFGPWPALSDLGGGGACGPCSGFEGLCKRCRGLQWCRLGFLSKRGSQHVCGYALFKSLDLFWETLLDSRKTSILFGTE